MDASDALPGFTVLAEEYLRSLTFGIYQLKQAKSYSREHINEKGGYEIYVSQTSPYIIFKVKYNHDMFRLKCIIFGYSTMEKTRKILSSIGTANASRGRVWWVVALMLHLFFGSSAYNDMKMMLVVKLYPIIFWTARRLLLRIFHLLVMNMIPLRIRLYCIFFYFKH